MATPLQWGHREATLLPPGYNLVWIKSCSIFSQSPQRLFLKWHLIPSLPPAEPPYRHSAGDTLEEGHAWAGGRMRNGRVLLWRSVWGLRRQGCTSLSRCLHVFAAVCVSRSTWPATVRKPYTYSQIVGVVAAVKRRGRRVDVELSVSSAAVKTDSC